MVPESILSSIGPAISFAITAIFVYSIIVGMIFGYRRGVFKTLIRIITLVLSVALCIILLSNAINSIEVQLPEIPLSELVSAVLSEPIDAGTAAILDSFDSETAINLVLLFVCVIAMPIIFVILFCVLKLLSLIVYAILSGVLGFGGRYKSGISRLLGTVAGAVQGAFIAIALTVPLIGLLGIAEDAREPFLADAPDEVADAVNGFYETYLDESISNPVYKFSRTFGGDFLFSTLSAASIEGERTEMREEAISIAVICADCSAMGEVNWTALTENNKTVLTSVLDEVGESRYLSSFIAGVLRGIGTAVENEAVKIELDDPIDDLAASLLTVFKDTSVDTFDDDLETFMNVYFILSDSAVLSHFDTESEGSSTSDAKDLLISRNSSGMTVVEQIIDELNKNRRTAHIVTELTKFSLKLMADSVGNTLPEDVDTEKLYTDVKVGISEALYSVNDASLTESEKKETVKSTITDALVESGVMTEDNQLDEEIMNSITDYVVENYEGKTELSDEDINNVILHYYEAYANKAQMPSEPQS